ncbi:MAG TPA: MEDS domain-containing protein [Solirubrobacteraceae bacterium]|nr:MEDS domain-containing protein [Solirubrobacteraceae bacterium]
MSVCEHLVQFYDTDDELVGAAVPYLATGLAEDDRVLVIATEPHRRSFEHRLDALGIDVDGFIASDTYVAVEATEILRRLRSGERSEPRPEDFDESVGRLVARLAGHGPLRVYSEMIALRWNAGDVAGAIALEQLWRQLQERERFTLFCGYPGRPSPERTEAVRRFCRSQAHVLPTISDRAPALETTPIEADFMPTLESPSRVRTLLRSVLRDGNLDEDLIERGTLAASELAANAVLHARTSFRLLVQPMPSSVWIGVEDGAPLIDRRTVVGRAPHGLGLIAALALRWGIHLKATGKIVWAEIPR